MSRDITELSVLIASPSDLKIERETAEKAMNDANRLLSPDYTIILRALRWEDLPSEFGAPPQTTINKNYDQYDFFIGLMGAKFGTPTSDFDSGTEEEFNIALRKQKQDPKSVHIMFYFSTQERALNEIDAEQLQKVNYFKDKAKALGIYKEFKSHEELRRVLSHDLFKHAIKWLADHKKIINIEESNIKTDISTSHEQIATNEGFLDILEIIEGSNHNAIGAILTITRSIMDVNLDTRNTANKIRSLENKPLQYRTKEAKRLLNKNANTVIKYSATTKENLPEFTNSWNIFIEKSIELLSIDQKIKKENIDDIKNNYELLIKLNNKMKEADVSLTEYVEAIKDIPKMTNKYEIAKKEAMNATSELINSVRDGRKKLRILLDAYENELLVLSSI